MEILELQLSSTTWYILLGLFSIPFLIKIAEKMMVRWVYPRQEFAMTVYEFTKEANTFAAFGKTKSFYKVGFGLNDAGLRFLKHHTKSKHKPIVYLSVDEQSYQNLKKVGLKQNTGLVGIFAFNRFGKIYFIKYVKDKIIVPDKTPVLTTAQKQMMKILGKSL